MDSQNTAPWIIYGTAWKKERTTQLVEAAITKGFLGIDTANQPKHYSESLVGDALLKLKSVGISRESLFLQTKFTPVDGQDKRLPYDPTADIKTQVRQSFESSLKQLHTDYLDSYLLHGPHHYPDLGEEDWQVWEVFEELSNSGRVKRIGISNVNAQQTQELVNRAKIKPMVVQNRCFARLGWDKAVREICRQNQMMYQGFSLLTANPEVLEDPLVETIAKRLKATNEQVIFAFARQMGMTPLTGTTDTNHMREDLKAKVLELNAAELKQIESSFT